MTINTTISITLTFEDLIIKFEVLAAAITLGLTVGFSQVQEAHADNVGCGLGSTIFAGQSGLAPQVLAVTTNGTFGNQTFGITSGTLGCDDGDSVVASAEVRQLADANLDKLAVDIARGEGETLASLASAMKIKMQDQPVLFSTLKSNFSQIFPTDDIKTDDVLVSIRDLMAGNETLAPYVDA